MTSVFVILCCIGSPLPPQITSIAANYWSATIYWVHNTTCFEHCEFLVELGNFTATTKATSIHIDRLKPGQRYKVDVTAQCTSRAPSHELRGSTKGTREFQTKGMYIINNIICYYILNMLKSIQKSRNCSILVNCSCILYSFPVACLFCTKTSKVAFMHR